MVRRSTLLVEHDLLRDIFAELSIWRKIEERTFYSTPSARSIAPSHHYPGCTARHLKHFNAAGIQTCTTHQIVDPLGNIVHWDETNIYFGDLIIGKRGELPQLP
jgi:hypothetical protein